MFLTAGSVPKSERDAGTFALVRTVVDRLAKELVVRQADSFRASSAGP